MELSVSVGEALDKYSILQLKSEYITHPAKREQVLNEQRSIAGKVTPFLAQHTVLLLYKLLLKVNRQIWHMIEKQRTQRDSAELCATIMDRNDARYRVKQKIDRACNSAIKEQKSHHPCRIVFPPLPSVNEYLGLWAALLHCILEYDEVVLSVTDARHRALVERCFPALSEIVSLEETTEGIMLDGDVVTILNQVYGKLLHLSFPECWKEFVSHVHSTSAAEPAVPTSPYAIVHDPFGLVPPPPALVHVKVEFDDTQAIEMATEVHVWANSSFILYCLGLDLSLARRKCLYTHSPPTPTEVFFRQTVLFVDPQWEIILVSS